MRERSGRMGPHGETNRGANTPSVSSNAPLEQPPHRTARCFCDVWLLRDGAGRVHTCEPGEPRTDCGLLVNDDWRRLPKSTGASVLDCPVCLRIVAGAFA